MTFVFIRYFDALLNKNVFLSATLDFPSFLTGNFLVILK
jgi:hypothetical protein